MKPLLPDDPETYGPHVLLARLGAGGTGVVYLARSPGGRLVAVKAVHAELAADPAFRERFAREVAALRTASGAFTASLVDADPEAPRPWLATAYLPGVTLEEAVQAAGPLPVPAVNALGAGLAEALVSIHRTGIAHRDLKPSNVLLTPHGPRLIDLGMARPPGTTEASETLAGTPGYLSPEQASGGEGGPEGDVFSLAAVLVFAATGAGPFEADTVPAVLYRVLNAAPSLEGVPDAELRAFLGTCLSREARERPTAAQMMEFFAGRPGAALPDPVSALIQQAVSRVPAPGAPPWRTAPPVGRRRLVMGLAVGGAVLLAGGGAGAAALLANAGSDDPVEWRHRVPDHVSELYVSESLVVAVGRELGWYAVDGRTRKRRWHRPDLEPPLVVSEVVFAGDIPVASRNSEVYAVDPATGEELWRHPAEVRLRGPACDRNIVCLPVVESLSRARIVGRDARTGAERWSLPASDRVRDIGAGLADGVVYFHSEERMEGVLAAAGAATGRLRWKVTLGRGVIYRMDRPVAAGGTVYVFDSTGVLHARAASDGSRRWSVEVGGALPELATEQVMVAGDAVYAMTADGTIRSFDPATGRMRWRLPTGVRPRHPLADRMTPTGDVVLVTARETLLAVGAADGRIRWQQEIGIEESAPVVVDGLAHLRTLHGIRSYDLADGRPVRLLSSKEYPTPTTLRAHRGLVVCAVHPGEVLALRPR